MQPASRRRAPPATWPGLTRLTRSHVLQRGRLQAPAEQAAAPQLGTAVARAGLIAQPPKGPHLPLGGLVKGASPKSTGTSPHGHASKAVSSSPRGVNSLEDVLHPKDLTLEVRAGCLSHMTEECRSRSAECHAYACCASCLLTSPARLSAAAAATDLHDFWC